MTDLTVDINPLEVSQSSSGGLGINLVKELFRKRAAVVGASRSVSA